MAPLARPENVLKVCEAIMNENTNTIKRAEELIHVEKSEAALDLLYETVSSKRTRNVSQSFLEPIILKFVELSVNLRKGKVVKDGLHQYKKLVQVNSIGSIEVVVKKFLEMSEQKVATAQAESNKISDDIDDNEDLEAASSPEDILLSTVSSEEAKDRTDREVVTPWLKFLWEAYRSTLELLRNNSKLEVLYQQVVKQAFEFCLKYSRKTEFRRLCELLRTHLQSVASPQYRSGQPNMIDLSDADTIKRYLDTRFDQLNVAVKLELWQEAFRSVEDVHTLLTVSKRGAKVSTMASYYENLARIFIVSGNQLFHSAAWSRYYSLVLQARSVPEAELTRIASLLLLSALSIPTFNQQSRSGLVELGEQKHRNNRLTGLLNLSKTPTRETLLKSALTKNVLSYCRPEIRDLYNILEVDFHPLAIKSKLGPIIEKIGQDSTYQPYVKSLYQVILTRLFQQLSQVYKTVKLDFVINLATFPAPFDATRVEIEKFIVRGCQKGEFGMRIDHESKSITFVDDLYDSSARASSSIDNKSALQATPSDIVRTQMSRLGKSLYTVVNEVDPVYINDRINARQAAVDRAEQGFEQDNEEVLNRKDRIQARQKNAEAEQARREEEEVKKRALRIQQEQQAERERLEEDQKKRELERIKREQDAIKETEKRKIAEEINAKGIIKIDVNNLDEIDTEKLKVMQVEQLNKENKDLNERLRVIGRRMDHIERAFRKEEIPLWQNDAEEQQIRDKKAHEARNELILQKSKEQYEERKLLRDRLQRIVPEYKSFRQQVESKRAEEFEKQRAENERKLQEAKKQRIEQKRREHEEAERRREAEAEERRKREEEEEKQRAEEAAKPQTYRPGAFRQGGAPAAAPAAPAAPTARPSTPPPSGGPARYVPGQGLAQRPPPPPTSAAPSQAPPQRTGGYVPPHLRK